MKKNITLTCLLFQKKCFFFRVITITLLLSCSLNLNAQIFWARTDDSLELVKFFHATGGPNWKNKTGWLQGPVHTWYGVGFGAVFGNVYGIELPNNNLTGQIPDLKMWLGLQTLDLTNNKLTGNIPDFTGGYPLGGILYLYLDSNQLTGIPNFTGKSYEKISIRYNQLSGTLPAFSLPNLLELYLTSNQLTGINNLNCPSIQYMDIDSNKITGSLPNFNLPYLRTLNLESNQLTGTIPGLNLPNVTSLNLKSNKLTGSIPVLNLPNAIIVDLSDNQLSGGIAQVILNSFTGLNLLNNRLNFDGMENIYSQYSNVFFHPQATIKINKSNNILSVNAGGTLSKNTYRWFQKQPDSTSFILYKQAVGDSTLNNPPPGSYYSFVTNTASPLLLLFSDTINIGIQLQLSNPNSSMINDDGSLDSNLALLDFGRTVIGGVTDGITKILLVAESTDSLKFSIVNPKDGRLSKLTDQYNFSNEITVLPRSGKVVAVYTVPDGYGITNPKGGRDITVKVYNAKDNLFLRDVTIKLKTPPVVLVHGMWSSPRAWVEGGFEDKLINEKFGLPYLVNYEKDNFRTFNPDVSESKVVRDAILDEIKIALAASRLDGYVATQVDVVGHSLGGLMTRSLSQQNEFISKENYRQGYVHKLITLGTPHRGSPFGPEIYNNRNLVIKRFGLTLGKLSDLFADFGQPIGSVHQDFGNQSSGIKALKQTPPFKTFAITANYKGEGILPGQIKGYLSLTTLTKVVLGKSLDEIMYPKASCPQVALDHDLIVPLSSQKGYISKDTIFYNTAHSGPATNTETNSPEVQNKVVQLLLSNDTTAFHKGFPAPSGFPLDCTVANQRTSQSSIETTAKQSALNGDQSIQISSPVRGTVYSNNSGATITVSFDAISGAIPKDAILLTKELGWFPFPQTPPYTVSFTLPPYAPVGKIDLIVVARDATDILLADTSHIVLTPTQQFLGLRVEPKDILLDTAIRSKSLFVEGYYYSSIGGVHHYNMADIGSGTTYRTKKNNSIVKVDSKGVVSAVSPGTDTIVVRNTTDSVKVLVTVDNNYSSATFFSNSITFPAIGNQTIGSGPFSLLASSTSGDAVNYSVVSGPATITNSIISLTGAGKVTVKAFQAGNIYYAAAADVSQTFCVKPVKPVITQSGTKLLSSTFNGNQWYLNGNPILGATDSVYSPAASGNYTLNITQNTCSSDLSDPVAYVVTGLNDLFNDKRVMIMPNPVHNKLFLVNGITEKTLSLLIYDITGKVLYKKNGLRGNDEFDFSSYANSIYVVEIRDNKLNLILRKMIVKQ